MVEGWTKLTSKLLSVILDKSTSTDYHRPYRLSGIAQHNGREHPEFLVPRERTRAVIGTPTSKVDIDSLESVVLAEDLQQTTYFKDKELTPSPTKFGYPVHARCWSLCERVVGPDVEQHMGSFLETLRRRFRKRISPQRNPGTDASFACYGRPLRGIGPKTRFLFRDPFVIPAVDELIERCSLGDAGPGYQCHYHYYPFRIRLPEELQFLIWDFLDRADVDVLHRAFTGKAQWTMPDTYWVSRAAKSTTIFEIQDLFFETKRRHNQDHHHHHTNVDWESLCFQAQELTLTSEALQNRRRILRILERTNKLWCALRMQSVSASSAQTDSEAEEEEEEDRYDSDCPEHGYDGRCRPGLSVGSSIYEDEDDANGLPYKSKIEAIGNLDDPSELYWLFEPRDPEGFEFEFKYSF